jgi:DNA polymerase-1
MSAFGLSQNLNIERQQAQKYMDLYFERYPNVQKYMEETRKIAEAQGYVESLFGRRIYVPEIHSSNIPRRRAAERQAINAPMQSSAADIIKMAMICVDQWIESSELPVKMIMQVHDELVLEAEDSAVDVTIAALRECMEKAAKISVPLLVEIGVGKNWDEAH